MTKTKSQLISKEELIKVFIEDRTEGKKIGAMLILDSTNNAVSRI